MQEVEVEKDAGGNPPHGKTESFSMQESERLVRLEHQLDEWQKEWQSRSRFNPGYLVGAIGAMAALISVSFAIFQNYNLAILEAKIAQVRFEVTQEWQKADSGMGVAMSKIREDDIREHQDLEKEVTRLKGDAVANINERNIQWAAIYRITSIEWNALADMGVKMPHFPESPFYFPGTSGMPGKNE